MSLWVQTFTACPGVWREEEYRRFHRFNLEKSDSRNFGVWYADLPIEITSRITPFAEDARWGKIQSRCIKQSFYDVEGRQVPLEDPNGSVKTRLVRRTFIISLDPMCSYAGNIYNEDSKLAIYIKIFASVLGRPPHLAVQMIYHVIFGIARALFTGIKKEESSKKIVERVIRVLVDCVRIPLYGIALEIAGLVALFTSPFNPIVLYDFRAFTAQLTNELNWGKSEGFFKDLTPCMQRLVSLMDFDLNPQRVERGRQYENKENSVLVGLDNLI